MILKNATIKYSGINPNILTKGSNKRICVSCDKCGRVRWLSKQIYTKLCGSCARVNLNGQNNPNYKGGNSNRSHILPFNQCLEINKYFKGSHRHHISADVIIYIPRDLHYHIDHNLKDNKGMYEINLLSL